MSYYDNGIIEKFVTSYVHSSLDKLENTWDFVRLLPKFFTQAKPEDAGVGPKHGDHREWFLFPYLDENDPRSCSHI